jgi:hypothetical protein
MHGSREVVIIDGVDGPEFDHAAHQYGGAAIDVVFSADGKHSCYIAQRGDDLVEVRDNKEAFAVTGVNPERNGVVLAINQTGLHGSGGLAGHQCLVSPSGAHVAVVSTESPRAGPGVGKSDSYVFLDGVKSPVYRIVDTKQIAFVGERLVYVTQTNDEKWHMVINDKPGPAYDTIKSLYLSPDDKHYAFITQNGAGETVVLDGVPGTTRRRSGNGIQYLSFASTGRLGYIWDKGSGPDARATTQALIVDDQEVSEDSRPVAGITPVDRLTNPTRFVVFSPDGKRFGYAKPIPGGVAAVIDGKPGRAYDGIQLIQFSPDSKHVGYVGNRTLNSP